MPSNPKHGLINTSSDILSHPDVTTMDKSKLKAELNRLLVHINGNPGKDTLQAKLLIAYQDELLNRAGKHYRQYHNCFYRVLHTSKNKLCVTLGCTRYQVFAPGVVESPWTDYKSCQKLIKNNPSLDMTNHFRVCPGKMIVAITNGTVGLPSFPYPFHLCGNVSSIPNMELGQKDLHPTVQMISPTVLFKDLISPEKCQVIIDMLHNNNNAKWDPLTGGCNRRFYVQELARQKKVYEVVERVMKPVIDFVQAIYPSLVFVKFGALKTLPQCPSQYQGHKNRFHSDYESNFLEIAPGQRPVSVILALNLFGFQYLPLISLKRKDIVHLTVPGGHALIFTESCLYSGGANDSTNIQY